MRGRDRTTEFIATIQSKREKPQWIQRRQEANGSMRQSQIPNKLAADLQYKEFMSYSTKCRCKIENASEKVIEYNRRVKSTTVFDDGAVNRLMDDIRRGISEIASMIKELQEKQSKSEEPHTDTIVRILNKKLKEDVTTNFESTLKLRSSKVQQQAARHELFTGPSAPASRPFQPSGPIVLDMDSQNGPSAMTPHAFQDQPSQQHSGQLQLQLQQQQQPQQQLIMNDQIDLSERADVMQSIESTLADLNAVFIELANIVQHQGETISRIDMNISETTANVEGAHDALLRYFTSINSNRWLILKVFGVLFFFFIVFVVFGT